VIGQTAYPAGTPEPGTACAVCDPNIATDRWSQVTNGTACGQGQGLVCWMGTCLAGCFDGAAFYPDGQTSGCSICHAAVSTTLLPLPDGAACGQGRVCSQGACRRGPCDIDGAQVAAGTTNPANACQSCQPSLNSTGWSPSIFRPYLSVNAGLSSPAAVAAGDLNGDGLSDLAFVGGDGVSIVLSSRGGALPPTVFPLPSPGVGTTSSSNVIAIGDLNGDGRPEVAASNASNAWVNVYWNQGGGAFGSTPLQLETNGEAAGAWIGGGALAVTDQGGLTTTRFSSGGAIASTATTSDGQGGPVVGGDLNRDGILDFIFLVPGSVAEVVLGAPNGSLASIGNFPTQASATDLAVADFDGDGVLDVAFSEPGCGCVEVYLGQGNGWFAGNGIEIPTGAFPASIVAADFDGDGRIDLAVGDGSGLGVLLNQSVRGSLAFASEQFYALPGSPAQLARTPLRGWAFPSHDGASPARGRGSPAQEVSCWARGRGSTLRGGRRSARGEGSTMRGRGSRLRGGALAVRGRPRSSRGRGLAVRGRSSPAHSSATCGSVTPPCPERVAQAARKISPGVSGPRSAAPRRSPGASRR
jgi:hypothetical protein